MWKQLFLHLSDNKWKWLRPCVCYWSYRRTRRQFDTYSHCSEGSKTLMKLQCLVSLTYTCSNTQTGVGVWQCMCNTLNTKRRDRGHYYYHHSDSQARFIQAALATVCFAKGGERNLRHETQMHIKSWETLTMQTQVIKKLPSCVNWSSHLNFALCLAYSVLTLSSVSSPSHIFQFRLLSSRGRNKYFVTVLK